VILALLATAHADDPVWPPPAAPAPAPAPPADAWPPATPAAAPAAPAAPASDPWGTPVAQPTVNDPWGASGSAPAVPTATATVVDPGYVPPTFAGKETRETWSSAGLLVRRLVFVDGALQSETTWTYDAAGHPTEERAVSSGAQVVQQWTYNADGTTATHVVVADGMVQLQEVMGYTDGKVTSRAVTTQDGTTLTTTTYNDDGAVVLTETRSASGALAARTVADREPAPPEKVTFDVGLIGGVATSSDVRTTSVTAGFSVSRKPKPEQYSYDPIELGAYATYNRASSQGTLTNDQLKAGVGFDYNELVGPLTVFLFTSMERNPVANLDVDLLLAPVGVKYEFIPEGVFTLDASFAPLWNYRSIAVAAGDACDGLTLSEGGHCTFSKIRGSFRVRATLEGGPFKVKDVVEFLPTLNPDGDLIAAIEDEAIFRNTLSVDIKLTTHFSLTESVLFTRDPLLTAQIDCAADPDNLLCDGMSLQTGTTLALNYAF
jgi:YD repeat-containing protein